ncbi:hypothetical protein [Mucilaginibacter gotjawali]|nr:hypothetical protein [Mucilaginibacter gotjawali]MBB3058087.1 hypothetical protein [Mucilaginibacter gotjawali]
MPEQLKDNLSIGRSVEQWLGPTIFPNYVTLRTLTIRKERDSTYTTSYVASTMGMKTLPMSTHSTL